MIAILTRTYSDSGTNGTLECNGKHLCYTIELPWKNNERLVSCIPEGTYRLRKRHNIRFNWHLELCEVKGRKHILIHPANNALKELKGCIAPVLQLTGDGLGVRSRKAFMEFKDFVFKVIDLEEAFFLVIQS